MNSVKRRSGSRSLLLLAAAACGQFEHPDLQTGRLTGKIEGASAGAYAYVYGAPDRFAQLDAEGHFRIDGVPAGAQQIILFDGDRGAKMIPVQIQGSEIQELEEHAPLPAAGRIVVGVVPTGGCTADKARFEAAGTILSGLQAAGASAVELYPLPAGVYRVRATLAGFEEAEREIATQQAPGTPDEIELEVYSGDSPGCAANGCASPSLACDPSDGRCYACVSDAQCGSGRCLNHACTWSSGGGICAGCASAAQCAGNRCVAGPDGASMCTQSCSGPGDCPAGFDCRQPSGSSGGSVCLPLQGCATLGFTFGSICFSDSTCTGALRDGKCLRASGEDAAGYCTARCSAQQPCPASFTCDAGEQLCVRPH